MKYQFKSFEDAPVKLSDIQGELKDILKRLPENIYRRVFYFITHEMDAVFVVEENDEWATAKVIYYLLMEVLYGHKVKYWDCCRPLDPMCEACVKNFNICHGIEHGQRAVISCCK